jgi:hypothetical protein
MLRRAGSAVQRGQPMKVKMSQLLVHIYQVHDTLFYES